MSALKQIANQVLARAIVVFEKPIVGLMRIVARQPAVTNYLMRLLSKFPHLQNHLMQLYRQSDKNSRQAISNLNANANATIGQEMNRNTRAIYAIEGRHRREKCSRPLRIVIDMQGAQSESRFRASDATAWNSRNRSLAVAVPTK